MLSIIMPMYNSRDICTNLNEAVKILEEITSDFEIILVDDGSKNGCRKEAQKFKSKKVRIVGYPKNFGKGYAIKYGFQFTKGKYIAFVDSGRDLNPKQLKEFLEIIKQGDVVIGSKMHLNSVVHYPVFRRFMSAVYRSVNKLLFNLKVQDTQVGLKLFRREVLEKVMPKIVIKRFAFDLELLILANKYGFKIIEAPIVMRYRFKSTVNVKAVFWMLWDTAALFYRLKLLRYYDRT